LTLEEPVHDCGDPDCDGHGHSKSRLGEVLPCRKAWIDELEAYNRIKKAKEPKKRAYKK
jgi:hypothetical protein